MSHPCLIPHGSVEVLAPLLLVMAVPHLPVPPFLPSSPATGSRTAGQQALMAQPELSSQQEGCLAEWGWDWEVSPGLGWEWHLLEAMGSTLAPSACTGTVPPALSLQHTRDSPPGQG